jgi:hypothetical protein
MMSNMRKVCSTIFSVLLLFSCIKDDDLPLVETITKGSKWTLQIGSSPTDVYSQLQELGAQKEFDIVAVVYRQPVSKPEEIRDRLAFYRAITLQSNTGRIERVLFQFSENKVSSIEAGGGMITQVFQWPLDAPEGVSIYTNDTIDEFYAKLLVIYQMPEFSNYQIILPDKSLEKPFDPDMVNYNEWHFTFSAKVKPGINGTSSVRLYFSNDKLSKIRHVYDEREVYN